MKKEITNKDLAKLIDTLTSSTAKNFANVSASVNTLTSSTARNFAEVAINMNDMRTDLKSFKKDTQDEFKIVNEKIDDLGDTVTSYDKRIEALETLP